MNTHYSGARAPSRQRVRFVQGLLFALIAVVVLSMAPTLSAQSEATYAWEAYNDCAGQNNIANTTSITLDAGQTTGTVGELLDVATGEGTDVMAQFTADSALSHRGDSGAGGLSGTDVHTTFYGRVNLQGLIYHDIALNDWSVTLTLSGLDPDKSYTFAITANRNIAGFSNDNTRYSLSGDEEATNASTDGVSTYGNDHSVYFSTGYNIAGYVARWSEIQPGSDGTIQVTAQNHSAVDNRRAFVCNGFMLAEEVSAVATITTEGTLDAFVSQPGEFSAEQSYSLSGSDLTADLVITAPADFEISTTAGSGFGSSISLTPDEGTVGPTPIYVRFLRATAGTSTGDIIHSSEGATTVNVAVTGAAVNAPPAVLLVGPEDGATGVLTPPTLEVTVTDPEADLMDVTFYGGAAGEDGGEALTRFLILTAAWSYPGWMMRADEGEAAAAVETIGVVSGVASGENAAIEWPDLETGGEYEWYVEVSDGTSTTTSDIWSFTTGEVPNQAPTGIELSASIVAENEPAGTAIGLFTTTDPDAGDTHSYALVIGTGSADNASFTIADNELQTDEEFDFEADDTYTVRVRSTDAGGLTFEETFTITVENVNEAPTAIAGPDQTTEVSQPVTLDGSGSTDPEDDELIYGWTQTGGTAVVLSGATTGTPSFTAPAGRETLTFSLTVTDTAGLASASDEVSINLLQPKIAISKQANPTSADPGETITYSYTITNTGDVALSGVSAEDDLLGPLFAEPINLAAAETRNATRTYTIVEGDLPGPLVNTVVVTGTSPMGAVVADSAQAAVILTSQPAITVLIEANVTSANVGQEITYSYTVLNAGDVSLNGITAIDDQLGEVTLSATTLQPLESATGTLSYIVTEDDLPGPLVNTVVVTGAPPVGDEVTASDEVGVTVTSQPAISVLKEASVTTATVGEEIVYTYTVVNEGDVTLIGVTAVDDLLGEVTLSATTLLPTQSATGTLSYTVTEDDLPGPLVNTVVVTGAPPVGQPVSAEDSVSLPVQEADAPALEASLTASADVVRPGERITYTLTLTNSGNVPLADLESVVSVPGGFVLPDELLPGQSIQASYSYTALTSDLPGPLVNEVTVTSTAPGEQSVTVTVTATTAVERYRMFLPMLRRS